MDLTLHVQGREVCMRVQPSTGSAAKDGRLVGLVQSFPPFEMWVERMNEETDFMVSEVVIQHVECYEGGGTVRPGIVKLQTILVNERGVSLPASFLLRGPAAVGLISYRVGERDYVVVSHKVRVSAGAPVTELPSGMVDPTGAFRGLSVDVLQSIVPSLQLDSHTTKDLTELVYGQPLSRLRTLPQYCDESFSVLLYRRRVDEATLGYLQSVLKEAHAEKHPLYFELLPLGDVLRCADAKTVASCHMLCKVIEEGGSDLFTHNDRTEDS